MRNVYEKLRTLPYFLDNEYLKTYALLIERNVRTKPQGTKTHKHHIIPKSWFKLVGKQIDNSLCNLVNVSYREHTLAHYLLCLCTHDPFKYANELALMCLLQRTKLNTVDKQLLQNLPMYNNIYEDYCLKRHQGYRLYETMEENIKT